MLARNPLDTEQPNTTSCWLKKNRIKGRSGNDVTAQIRAKGLPVQGRICEDSVLITILTNSLERANKIHKEDIELDKMRDP